MTDTGGVSIWPILMIAGISSYIGQDIAKSKSLNNRKWAVTCFLFPPAVIAILLIRPRSRPGETKEFYDRWRSLAAYDPDIKTAIDKLSMLGPEATVQFRLAYAEVQTKESIPFIVADIERRWAAGERFGIDMSRLRKLTELHAAGRITDQDYEEQKHRLLSPSKSRTLWPGWWWKTPLLVILVLMLWPRSGSAGFPTCDARTTRELVRGAIEGAEDSRVVTRKLLTLDEVRELSGDAAKRDRFCSGTATLNSGEKQIVWRLYTRGDSVVVNVSGF